MTEAAEPGDDSRLRLLEAEVLAMRQQVEMRDELLRVLNRRLLTLERGELDAPGVKQIGMTRQQNEGLRGVVRSILDTEMFRWTAPARRLRGKLHARRQGSA
jgi:hypothetical protein